MYDHLSWVQAALSEAESKRIQPSNRSLRLTGSGGEQNMILIDFNIYSGKLKRLGSMEIRNTTGYETDTSNYEIKWEGQIIGRVEKHDRSLGWYPLVKRALDCLEEVDLGGRD